jgi:hypothetical protein
MPQRLASHAGLVGRVVGLWLALFAVAAVVPPAPVFLPSNFDARNSNWCEILSTRHAGKSGVLSRGEIAQFQKTQPLLLQQEFAGLTAFSQGRDRNLHIGDRGLGRPNRRNIKVRRRDAAGHAL